MSRLYACIISTDAKRDREVLLSIARRFSYNIEALEDGVLFDVSGLKRLVGAPQKISQKILGHLRKSDVSASVAVAETVETVTLLARQNSSDNFQQLPLESLEIDQGTLNVFSDLGITKIEELLRIPTNELINRYGQEFMDVIHIVRQNGRRFITPNVKQNNVSWACDLDFPVEDFEQLIFILNHGLDKLFGQVVHYGFSTEHLDISFKLRDKSEKGYEIKTSFPTLEKTFWLKLINLRVSLDPPQAGILSVSVVSHFTRPRPGQKGLYAVSRPEPESLLLTANKLKKLVGEENVGMPVLLDQRLPEAFALDADRLPTGKERVEIREDEPVIAFSYFNPPLPANVSVVNKCLASIRTQHVSGAVKRFSGVWRQNSRWWNRAWNTEEWDIELEEGGIYRLCKVSSHWFLVGEYD